MKEVQNLASRASLNGKTAYSKPEMKKHDPIKVVQGSGGGGCVGYLYYTSLYYTYYYYYYY